MTRKERTVNSWRSFFIHEYALCEVRQFMLIFIAVRNEPFVCPCKVPIKEGTTLSFLNSTRSSS